MSGFFKAALPYRLTSPVELLGYGISMASLQSITRMGLVNQLNERLNQRPSREPGVGEMTTYGWTEPYPTIRPSLAERNEDPELDADGEEPTSRRLVRSVSNGNFLVLCAQHTYRNMPASVIRQELARKVNAIEERELRRVYKKERDQLKDDVVAELLPRAFIMQRKTMALIDTDRGIIWINSASAKNAEDLLSLLREALGSLPVRPVSSKIAPSATFTQWVRSSETPDDFYLLDHILLEDTDREGGKVGAVHQDLTTESIQMHVSEGKIATKIAIAYKDHMGFVVNDKVQFTKIRFSDMMEDRADQQAGDDAHNDVLLDTTYYLMGNSLRDMLYDLLLHLGGEEIPQGL